MKTFKYTNFVDAEGDIIMIDCSNRVYNTSLPATWTNAYYNLTQNNVTLYGTLPGNNGFSGNYIFTCVIQDNWQDGNTTSVVFTLTVTPKPNIVITGTPLSVSARLPNTTSVSTLALDYDINSLPYRKVLYINNTIWSNGTFGTWVQWNESIQNVTVTPYANTQAGIHQMGVMLNDQINTPVWINFTMQVVPDFPLEILMELPNL